MKSVLAPFAAAAFLTGVLAQTSGFMINTPTNPVVCQPLLLTWTGGSPPYFLSILPGNQPGATALVDLGPQTGTSFTWTVNIAPGTSIGLNLRDSSGQNAQSAPFNVNPGSDTSCVGKNPTSSGSPPSTTGPSTTGGGATSPPAASTTPTTTTQPPTIAPPATTGIPTTTTRATTTTPSTTGAPSTTTSNAASSRAAQLGAGVLGAAIIAFIV